MHSNDVSHLSIKVNLKVLKKFEFGVVGVLESD